MRPRLLHVGRERREPVDSERLSLKPEHENVVSEIRWYVDDVLYAMQNNWSSTGGEFPAPFDQPFYIIFNVAVGGNFPGSPNASTVFPVTMEVDWVRVYSGQPAPQGD